MKKLLNAVTLRCDVRTQRLTSVDDVNPELEALAFLRTLRIAFRSQ